MKSAAFSHAKHFFAYALFNAAYFCTLQGKTNVSKTRNECLRRVLRLNAMF